MRTCWTRVAAGATRRIVYVADASCYGATRAASNHRGRAAAALRLGTLPHARARSPRRIRRRRAADRHGASRMGLRQRLVVSRTRHRAGHGGPPRAAVRRSRAVGVADSRPGLRPRAGASRRARRSRRPVLPREQRSDPDARVRGRRSPASRTVRCACGACPRRPPGSWSVRSWPTTSGPTPCSRTSGCAGSASASRIPRSSRDSSKSSERSMNNVHDRDTAQAWSMLDSQRARSKSGGTVNL